ncbi:lytic polysaccharide monooxygenase, partial [Aaosphaeria arxii CBS 175.79]
RKQSSNYPLEDVTSKDMACNVGGDTGVQGLISVPQGAELTFEFKASLIDKSKPRLEPGHKGPCAVYLKKVDSAEKAAGSGSGWFKVWDEGYDSASGQWCTTKYTPTGKFTITLPKGLQAGEYLAKPELLALHNALEGRPQFFTGCMQIKIEGEGNLVPESTVSIPGYVKASDESVTFNIYSKGKESTYKTPGPSV